MLTNTAQHGPYIGAAFAKGKATTLEITDKFTRVFLGVGLFTAHALRQPVIHATSRGSQHGHVCPAYEQGETVSGEEHTVLRTG
jgi:hypothetical protein